MGLRGARAPSTGSMWRMFLCPHESLLDDRHRWCLLGFLWPMKPLRGQLTGFGGQRASNMIRCVLQQWELLKEFYCRLLSKMTRLWNGYKAAATSRPMASPVPFFTFFHSGIDWGLGAFLCVFHTFCPGSSVIPQSETCTSGWMEMLKRPEWLLSHRQRWAKSACNYVDYSEFESQKTDVGENNTSQFVFEFVFEDDAHFSDVMSRYKNTLSPKMSVTEVCVRTAPRETKVVSTQEDPEDSPSQPIQRRVLSAAVNNINHMGK